MMMRLLWRLTVARGLCNLVIIWHRLSNNDSVRDAIS